jgi:uncharacterized membrane protein
MTEFTHGIQGAVKKLLTSSSIALAIIYTLGHIVIAMTVVSVMTGASLWEYKWNMVLLVTFGLEKV